MILSRGTILPTEEQSRVLEQLPGWINETLARPPLLPEVTIAACDRLSRRAQDGEFDREIAGLDLDPAKTEEILTEACEKARRLAEDF